MFVACMAIKIPSSSSWLFPLHQFSLESCSMAEDGLMRIDQIRDSWVMIAGSSHLASSSTTLPETKSKKAMTTGGCHTPSYCPDLLRDICNKEYHHRAYCPKFLCDICYKVGHHPAMCSYLDFIPQGAIFSPRYQIVCDCKSMFDQDNWVCTSCCGKNARLFPKHCFICNISFQHATHECPKDKIVTAEYKLARDKSLERARSTVGQIYVPKVSYHFTPLGYSGGSSADK